MTFGFWGDDMKKIVLRNLFWGTIYVLIFFCYNQVDAGNNGLSCLSNLRVNINYNPFLYSDFRVCSIGTAKRLLREVRELGQKPEFSLSRYREYTHDDKGYIAGFEIHGNSNPGEAGVGNDLLHIKWYFWGIHGHIFYGKPVF